LRGTVATSSGEIAPVHAELINRLVYHKIQIASIFSPSNIRVLSSLEFKRKVMKLSEFNLYF